MCLGFSLRKNNKGRMLLLGFSAVYVHIPFCLKKCNYCDFLSYPGKPDAAIINDYFIGLEQEFTLWQKTPAGNIFNPGDEVTVYFGGGTPSLMPVDFIRDVIAMIAQAAAGCGAVISEVTIEANPGTLNQSYLTGLKAAGVTRISLGAQSFDKQDLREMGRLHTAVDTREAVALGRDCGFTNISLDLIANLPGQTVEKWLDNLKEAVALGVEHISCYGLHLSESSPWGRAYALGKLDLPDEDREIVMWQKGRAYLQEMGYKQYEISNFAKPGKECQHNLNYWRRENYLGLGLGAASCYGAHRWSNEMDIKSYLTILQEGRLPVGFQEALTADIVLAEGVFLGLRCTEGILYQEINEKYGVQMESYYQREIAYLEKAGLLLVSGSGIRLSSRGQLLANTVFAAFLPE